jgi:hypothetical protein
MIILILLFMIKTSNSLMENVPFLLGTWKLRDTNDDKFRYTLLNQAFERIRI